MNPITLSLWTIPAGVVGALGLVVGLAAWQRRNRKQRGERPPQTEKLLRPPGHYVSQKLTEADENGMQALMQTAVAGASFAAMLAYLVPLSWNPIIRQWMADNGGLAAWFAPKVLPTTLSVVLFVVGAVCWFIFTVGRCFHWAGLSRNLQLGYRGEQAVGESLLPLLGMGYRVFHDFPEKTLGNIDHIAVGPGGVFAVETKTRSKRTAPPGKEDHKVQFDGKVLRFPWCYDERAVPQAERNARWLAEFLTKATGMPVEAFAVLVVPGWYVESLGNYPVKAMNAKYLAKFLATQPPRLPADAVQRIAFQVEQRCRDVEF